MNSTKLDLIFPTAVWKSHIDVDTTLMHKEVQKTKKELGMDANNYWICNTLNTANGDYNLLEYPEVYGPLMEHMLEEVKEFVSEFGIVDSVVSLAGAWVNIAPVGGFQEFHIHPQSHFSAVYYLNVDKGCGDIVLRHPKGPKMFPLESFVDNLLQHSTYSYTPTPGMLIVFRSDIEHLVQENRSTSPRISIAANFVVSDQD
jgi:uncharacterized protein (TIGR02466 family)